MEKSFTGNYKMAKLGKNFAQFSFKKKSKTPIPLCTISNRVQTFNKCLLDENKEPVEQLTNKCI